MSQWTRFGRFPERADCLKLRLGPLPLLGVGECLPFLDTGRRVWPLWLFFVLIAHPPIGLYTRKPTPVGLSRVLMTKNFLLG